MAGHFQELLRQITRTPEARVSELGMVSQDERRHVLEECNNTAAVYPHDSCLHHLFEEQARLTPDAVAMVWNGASYSYRFLNERANQLARYLRSQGIERESRVALCMERSLEMVVGLLGILKAGAAYVPMDPLYPRERLGFMIEDSGAQLVLTQQKFVDNFQNQTVPIIALDETWPDVAALPGIDCPWRTTPENLAYILYTSGTTGEPKGIEISHRALVNHSTAMARHYGLQPTDRVLQFASISFDVAAEECFPTWAAGAAVVLRPNEPVPAFSDFEQFIEDHGLTVLNLPTPYWAEWSEAIEQTGTALPHPLRLVIVGSEKALPESLVRWQRLAGDRIAWCNSYGPTETTITASYFVPERQQEWMSASTVPIGRPIANVQLYVLNPALQPVPIGVAGELYIGGVGLARGYHRQPARTAETFLPDCFSRAPGRRLYRTGDKVRRLADGNVEFLGRYDDQIKIRGFRVEPAEIECRVKQHPAVKDARVFQEMNDQPGLPAGARRGEPQLVGYVVPRAEGGVTAQDLRSFLAERLPGYMIPAAWIFLDAFPITTRGKVDRQALRGLARQAQKTEPASAPLQTETERAIAEIWKDVLGRQAVGRHDNFFELGGDSIVSLQVIARAKQVGLLLSPRQIFQHQTVAELAAMAGREAVVALEAEQGAVMGEAALTPIQCAFFELPLVNPHHWNQSVLLEAKEPLAESALETAVAALIAHHDALRLRFVETDDGWRQSHAPIPQGPLRPPCESRRALRLGTLFVVRSAGHAVAGEFKYLRRAALARGLVRDGGRFV